MDPYGELLVEHHDVAHVDDSQDWEVDHLHDVHHPRHPHSRPHLDRDIEFPAPDQHTVIGIHDPGYTYYGEALQDDDWSSSDSDSDSSEDSEEDSDEEGNKYLP